MKILPGQLPDYIRGRLHQGGRFGPFVRAANARRKRRSPAQEKVANAFRVSTWFAGSLTLSPHAWFRYALGLPYNCPAQCVKSFLSAWYYSYEYPVDLTNSNDIDEFLNIGPAAVFADWPLIEVFAGDRSKLNGCFRISRGRDHEGDPAGEMFGPLPGWYESGYAPNNAAVYEELTGETIQYGKWYLFQYLVSNAHDNQDRGFEDAMREP